MERQKYIIVAGPTASGKTGLAIALAKRYGGQVVSADSMQIYADVQVGTARPTEEERDGVPHHLMGFLPLQDKYSVARYLEDANRVFSQLTTQGVLPVMCGGTGLYIQSFMENRQLFDEQPNPAIRRRFEAFLAENGEEALLEKLRQIDPATAAKLHQNDTHRVIRALEVYHTTGRTIGQQDAESKAVPSPYDPCLILLNFRDRQALYDRINYRVDIMLENGLLEEAKRILRTDPDATVTQAIGYKEFRPYFEGTCSLQEAADRLKQQTRRYAKRQLSWFRRMEAAATLYVDDYTDANQLVKVASEVYESFRLKGERL